MKKKSWHLNRRTVLKSAASIVSLPLLEGMLWGKQEKELNKPVGRFCSFYFPYGVQLKRGAEKSGWFPEKAGKGYQMSSILSPLKPHYYDLTILGGLSHPQCRKMGGHDTADTFLTGSLINNEGIGQTVSCDTVASDTIGKNTRFKQLVLSLDSGVGSIGRRTTISCNHKGHPISPISRPRSLFNNLFSNAGVNRSFLDEKQTILDSLNSDIKSLNRRLGKNDKEKIDEYLTSIREVEGRIRRSKKWLDTPKPKVVIDSINIDADPKKEIDSYLNAMIELIALALYTDSTRTVSFQIGRMGDSIGDFFPKVVDENKHHHTLAHKNQTSEYDKYLNQLLSKFLSRLKTLKILDSTITLFGSSNSKTHSNVNYPLVLAGGKSLGISSHGEYKTYSSTVPLSNLFLGVLNSLGVETDKFSDSTEVISGIFK